MQLNQRYAPKLLQMHCSKQCIVSLNQGVEFTHGLQLHSAASADHCLERMYCRYNTSLQMITIHKNIVPKWFIAGAENLVFGDDKKLYNMNTDKEVQPVLKGYTIGYHIKGKFMSRKQIKPLLKRYVEEKLPF